MRQTLIHLAATVALAAVVVSCFENDELPAPGSFRVTNLGGRPSKIPLVESSPGPLVLFRVDYSGPKEYAEIYIENWDGPTLVSTAVLFHKKFGSAVFERHDWGTNFVEGPAFSHAREVFAVRLIDLPEPLSDGRTTLAIVNTGNPDHPTGTSTNSTLVRLERGHRGGTQWMPALATPDGSGIYPDTDTVLLWQKHESARPDPSFHPPFDEGTQASRLFFRFVDR